MGAAMSSAWGSAWGEAWGDAWGSTGPTPVIDIDTHDGADARKKKKESRKELRELLERLIDGPVPAEVVERAAAIEEPTKEALAELARDVEAEADEEDEEERILMMAGI